MKNYSEIIEKLCSVADSPAKSIYEMHERTDKKIVGCFPVYTPAELVYAADMIPVGLWGSQVNIDKAKAYVPAFCCSIMQSVLELGLKGSYSILSAVLVPSLCDTLKCIGQNFKIAAPDIRTIQFTHPQMRKIEAGTNFLRCEYTRVKKALEEVSGNKITDDKLYKAINVFNANRAALRKFVGLAALHSDIITPIIRHGVIKSGYFMEKPEHTALVNELCDALEKLPVYEAKKKVVITGIMVEPNSLLQILSTNGFAVVADDLAHESRQFRYDVPTDSTDQMYNLAKWWSIFEGCSLAFDPEKKRIDMILSDVKKHKADGVIVCMMKFCDPEEYDYPLLKKKLEEKEIPELYMEIDQQSGVNAQAQTRIQAFSEILA